MGDHESLNEGQTTQEKGKKRWSTKHYTENLRLNKTNPIKTRG